MKKELYSKLKEIAIAILSVDDETDVEQLKQQASMVYEQLSVLSYLNKNEIKEPITKPATDNDALISLQKESAKEVKTVVHETLLETQSKKIEQPIQNKVVEKATPNLLYELDDLTAGFENLPEFEPANKTINTTQKPTASLNESLNKGISIGLNDRLAFVKHLFGGNQEDYTRVVSQLNTISTAQEASDFIKQMVKPEYNNWDGKEDIEERFVNAVFSRFED